MVRETGRAEYGRVGLGAPGVLDGVASAPSRRWVLARRAAVALVGLAVAILVFAGRADAFIYWTNSDGGPNEEGAIGRANLDGTGVNQNFIGSAFDSILVPQGIALDGAHIYWANLDGDSIGRANLDGTGVNQSLTGALDPEAVAVDSNFIYWTETFNTSNQLVTRIARANIDGSGANESFIATNGIPDGVAVDSKYIYWTNFDRTIGRANLDGTGVNQNFITGANGAYGVAVDSNYIYWTNSENGTIGRANLDGTHVDQDFITGNPNTEPEGIAVDSTFIYWANASGGPQSTGSIGRANLNGTGVNENFIAGATSPAGVAVNGLGVGAPPPGPASKAQCKHGGWFPRFKNQGQCVRFFASGGKNPASGS